MPFCGKCGAPVEENEKFCSSCGEATQAKAPAEDINAVIGNLGNIGNAADTTGEYEAKDINDNKVLALLAYLGFLFFIPLVAAPKSKFARFHANQGFVLFLAEIIAGVAVGIVSVVLVFIPVVGIILEAILTAAVTLGGLALTVIGIVNAANGKAKELPLIGGIKLIK